MKTVFVNVRFLFCTLLLVAASNSGAVVTDVFTLKNGTILEGYIQEQVPGGDYIICASRSITAVPASAVVSSRVNTIPYDKLSEDWKAWVEEHPDKASAYGGGRGLPLVTLEIEAEAGRNVEGSDSVAVTAQLAADSIAEVKTVKDVLLLEEGENIRYLDMKKAVVTVLRDDVTGIRPVPAGEDDLSGFSDELELNSGAVIQGRLVETIPGVSMKIKTENGIVKSYKMDEVSARRRMKINAGQTHVEQSPVLEKAYLKDGKVVEGVMIEQRYGNGKQSSSILLVNAKNRKVKLYNSNISRMCRLPNPYYRPVVRKKLEKGVVYANDKKLVPTALDGYGSRIILPQSSVNTVTIGGEKGLLKIETADDGTGNRICLLPLAKKDIDGYFVIESKRIIDIAVPLNEKNITDGAVVLTYIVQPGIYAVYMPEADFAYVCNVEVGD